MTRVESNTDMDAPANTIWNVLMEPSYLPKLYPYIVTEEAIPPGRAAVGQKLILFGRVGAVRVKITIQLAAVQAESRLVSRNVPGALFATFEHTVTLSPDGFRTQVKSVFEYSLSSEYLQKVPDAAMLELKVNEGLQAYARNLKEISELLPLPS
ncbi:MAG: SRPBCC family protein [Thaumarchaeota archaeon]|nr:SRPBCC family protein [Nitrososphaerota archaeon]